MEELIQVLEKTTSPNQNELHIARDFLDAAARTDLPNFIRHLSSILYNSQCSAPARMQAGLQLKNCIYSKDPVVKQKYQIRWLNFSAEERAFVKHNCLQSLGTEQTGHSTAAQCVAYIACAELPVQQWPELMPTLVQNVIGGDSTAALKQATLEAIGYICQDIDPNILVNQSNEILTAIVNGMKKDESSDSVRLAATTALLNSLEFIKSNFDNQLERNFIMQVVCENTQSTNSQLRVAALQCVVRIMSLYYPLMEQYMAQALFAISLEAMKSDVNEIALQGIEFWSTVCDEEIFLAMEAEDAAENGTPASQHSRYYARGALQYILPILMQRIAAKDEHDDEDEWNPSKSAGVCLMLLAQACRNDIVTEVTPFIRDHIASSDWRLRDTACYAFGAILEGPSADRIRPLIDQAFPILNGLLRDGSSVAVRDTAAWTIGRIFELHPQTVLPEEQLRMLISGLLEGVASDARVASNCCWTISSLAESCYKVAKGTANNDSLIDDVPEPPTYALSVFFMELVQSLLKCSDREDGHQHNLRNAAYSALMELMKYSSKDCYPAVQQTTLIVLERLKTVLQLQEQQHMSSQDKAQMNDLQSLLCGALQSVLRRIAPEDCCHIADAVMETLLRMLSTLISRQVQSPNTNGTTDENSTMGVQEDALLAISALVENMKDGAFLKYMNLLMPHLEICLKNHREVQVCTNALGLLSDLCRTLDRHIAPYAEQCLEILMQLLTNMETDKILKPHIISLFGDFAIALGTQFMKYLHVVLNTLQQATEARVDTNDVDMVEYLEELRKACLEAYSAIIQGLKSESNGTPDNSALTVIQPVVPFILSFLNLIAMEETVDTILAPACGLIGDLVTTFGHSILQAVEVDSISQLLAKGRASKNSKTRKLGVWATKEIRKLKNLEYDMISTQHNNAAATVMPRGDM